MEEQLRALIDELQHYPEKSLERQKALNRLLVIIQQFPDIYKSSHQDYPEALNKTWEWVCRKICEFQPNSSLSIQKSLTQWVNGYLRWRIKDLYASDSKYTISLDRPFNNNEYSDNYKVSMLDILGQGKSQSTTLNLLDLKIAQIQKRERQCWGERIQRYIKRDEMDELKNCHLKKNPECNCHLLAIRLLLHQPPHKIADIARQLNSSDQTVYSHWKRKCLPLLRQIGMNLEFNQ